MSKIRVVIGPNGTPRVEVLDAHGEECLDLTRALENRLGKLAGERELKPEYDDLESEIDTEAEEERGR